MSVSIYAAGGIVYRLTPDGVPEYLLIHRDRYGDWTIPKGKLDRKETFEKAAVREVWEETGCKCRLGPALGTTWYRAPSGVFKVVRYWLMESRRIAFRPNSEVDAIRWVDRHEALISLTYSRDRELLVRAHQMLTDPGSGRIYLIRHARAGERSKSTGEDRDRPLSRRGKRQTAALTEVLSEYPITRVLSSPYQRCRQTVAPLAERLDLPLEWSEPLAEGTKPRPVRRFIAGLARETAVVSTHGDIVERFITRLGEKGVALDPDRSWKKGSLWILDTSGGEVVRGRYLPPPAV
jgi:8-oxo-dGTP diphosphatase